ncbi:MAG: AtpZ/AtpI family protein [Sandaracinaceae bacterium]|nr:AtpZ/AtpI family protein [Sandaracinaceae bacterium]
MPEHLVSKKRREHNRAQRLVLVGIEFVVAITVGTLAGHWLDRVWSTAPWLLLTGILLGTIAAFKRLFEIAYREEKSLGERNFPGFSSDHQRGKAPPSSTFPLDPPEV